MDLLCGYRRFGGVRCLYLLHSIWGQVSPNLHGDINHVITMPSSKFIQSNAGCTVNSTINHVTFTVQINLPVLKQRARGADRSRATHCRPRNLTETSRFLSQIALLGSYQVAGRRGRQAHRRFSQPTRLIKSLLLSRSSGPYSRTPTGNFAFHLTVTNAFTPARHYPLLKNYSVPHSYYVTSRNVTTLTHKYSDTSANE